MSNFWKQRWYFRWKKLVLNDWIIFQSIIFWALSILISREFLTLSLGVVFFVFENTRFFKCDHQLDASYAFLNWFCSITLWFMTNLIAYPYLTLFHAGVFPDFVRGCQNWRPTQISFSFDNGVFWIIKQETFLFETISIEILYLRIFFSFLTVDIGRDAKPAVAPPLCEIMRTYFSVPSPKIYH